MDKRVKKNITFGETTLEKYLIDNHFWTYSEWLASATLENRMDVLVIVEQPDIPVSNLISWVDGVVYMCLYNLTMEKIKLNVNSRFGRVPLEYTVDDEIRTILDNHNIKTYYDYLRNEDEVYPELYAMFCANDEMPYGTAKARDDDPYAWVANKVFEFFDVVKP